MLTDLNIFAIAGAKARHAAARQGVIAQNVANADTPGYRARDLEPFEKTLQRIGSANTTVSPRIVEVHSLGAGSPNGNTVSIEDEMMRAGAAVRDHEIATTIYAKALTMMRTALGGRR
ncbi:MAG: flagellar basal body protein [Pseudomonadota bacterium]